MRCQACRGFEGTTFCASACPDASGIPTNCPGSCSPKDSEYGHCEIRERCPCYQSATVGRLAARKKWDAKVSHIRWIEDRSLLMQRKSRAKPEQVPCPECGTNMMVSTSDRCVRCAARLREARKRLAVAV